MSIQKMESKDTKMMKFPKIHCLNDYVAVVNIPITESIVEISTELPCEGVVVGMGPKAADSGVMIGDRVILANKRYIEIQPQSGDYSGKRVMIPKVGDVIIRKPPLDTYEIVDGE